MNPRGPEPSTASAARAALGQHVPMLRRYAFVLGVRADRVEDLVQDALVIALQKVEGAADAARSGAFLRGIARNLALRERGDAAHRREVELADQVWCERTAEVGGAGDGDERVAALRECVAALPEASRRLLDRRDRDGADREVLAAELGMRPEGVKSALRRLREGLKRCVALRLGRTQGEHDDG